MPCENGVRPDFLQPNENGVWRMPHFGRSDREDLSESRKRGSSEDVQRIRHQCLQAEFPKNKHWSAHDDRKWLGQK